MECNFWFEIPLHTLKCLDATLGMCLLTCLDATFGMCLLTWNKEMSAKYCIPDLSNTAKTECTDQTALSDVVMFVINYLHCCSIIIDCR